MYVCMDEWMDVLNVNGVMVVYMCAQEFMMYQSIRGMKKAIRLGKLLHAQSVRRCHNSFDTKFRCRCSYSVCPLQLYMQFARIRNMHAYFVKTALQVTV